MAGLFFAHEEDVCITQHSHNNLKELIMKKTIITSLVAVATLGFSGTSFAGNGGICGGAADMPPACCDDLDATIRATVTTTTEDNSTTVDVKTGDILTAIAESEAPAYAVKGDLAIATATAAQESSFPALETVLTPVLGESDAYQSGSAGTDGLVVGNINVAGAVGSGVGSNIGGAVFESINTATAIAINGTLGQ